VDDVGGTKNWPGKRTGNFQKEPTIYNINALNGKIPLVPRLLIYYLPFAG
jgi:hypothetical protein